MNKTNQESWYEKKRKYLAKYEAWLYENEMRYEGREEGLMARAADFAAYEAK